MKLRTALISMVAAALSLALVAPATAAVDFDIDSGQPSIAPSGPGDNGTPEIPGQPDQPGEPGATDEEPHGRDMPTLPENASPKAQAAVRATYERFAAISSRIDAIRVLQPGPERNAAMNELFADFSGMIHTVSDAVDEVDAENQEHRADGDQQDAELALVGDEEGTDGDRDKNRDQDQDQNRDRDRDRGQDGDRDQDGERDRNDGDDADQDDSNDADKDDDSKDSDDADDRTDDETAEERRDSDDSWDRTKSDRRSD